MLDLYPADIRLPACPGANGAPRSANPAACRDGYC